MRIPVFIHLPGAPGPHPPGLLARIGQALATRRRHRADDARREAVLARDAGDDRWEPGETVQAAARPDAWCWRPD